MRTLLAAAILAVAAPATGLAQISIQIGTPVVGIGIDVPTYPSLVPIPGYPVYYAPSVSGNYFFYDGMYWVLAGDTWYASAWYNGPWRVVPPQAVPAFVLRVPVRYYRAPPPWFHGWRADRPPRWGEHWGHDWEQRRSGWDRWDRKAAPPPAPLPAYQREYSGNRYPHPDVQPSLHESNYRYWPRDVQVRKAYLANGMRGAQQRRPQGGPPPGHAPPGQDNRGQGHPQGQGHEQGHGHGGDHGHGHE